MTKNIPGWDKVFNEFAGWQKGSFGLCLAGSEERLFFFPGKLVINQKTLKRYQLVVRKRNKAFLKIWSLSTPVEASKQSPKIIYTKRGCNKHLTYIQYTVPSELWSSQLWTQFKQLRIEAWKSQDFNGVWTRDLAIPVRRSNQLSYEVTDVGSWSFVRLGAGHLWVHLCVRTHKWPAPNVSGFIAQLVRASHR